MFPSFFSLIFTLLLLLLALARRGAGCTTCSTCTADQLTLTAGNNVDSTTPTASDLDTTSDGCVHITVTCTAINGGQTFMQFNVNQGGPINPTGSVVTAQLDCVNGQWAYQQGGISRVINEVNCQNT